MAWDISQLLSILKEKEDYVVTLEQDCLLIANSDGLDAWLAISGEQIIIESVLFSSAQVKDRSALDREILSTHMLFPLTTVGISIIDDHEYYVAFGALSSQSKQESIEIEIATLFQNVAGFLDAYEPHLNSLSETI